MKKITLMIICLVFLVTGISCSTIKGMGEDISAIGGWVTKGSESVKEGK